jgi:hypothetical protein
MREGVPAVVIGEAAIALGLTEILLAGEKLHVA